MATKNFLFNVLFILSFSSCRILIPNNILSEPKSNKGNAQIKLSNYDIENIKVFISNKKFKKELQSQNGNYFTELDLNPGVYTVIVKDDKKQAHDLVMEGVIVYPNKISFVSFPVGNGNNLLEFSDISKNDGSSRVEQEKYSFKWKEKTLEVKDKNSKGSVKGIAFDSIYSERCSNCVIKFEGIGNTTFTTTTNSIGEIYISNIPCGMYDVYCSENSFYNGSKDEWMPVLNVLIKPDSTSIVDFKNQFFGMGDDWDKKFK